MISSAHALLRYDSSNFQLCWNLIAANRAVEWFLPLMDWSNMSIYIYSIPWVFPSVRKIRNYFIFMTLFYISLVKFFLTNDTIHLKHFTGSKNKITIEKKTIISLQLHKWIRTDEVWQFDRKCTIEQINI